MIDVQLTIKFANLFDGEGCATCNTQATSGPYPQVFLGNQNEEVVRNFYETFGGSISHRKQCLNDKYYWIWQQSGRKLIPFFEVILPHVTIKRNQVELGLALARTLSDARRTPDNVILLRWVLWNKLSALNGDKGQYKKHLKEAPHD